MRNIDHSKCIRSVLDKDGTINRDVDIRTNTQAAGSGWQELMGCHREMSFLNKLYNRRHICYR